MKIIKYILWLAIHLILLPSCQQNKMSYNDSDQCLFQRNEMCIRTSNNLYYDINPTIGYGTTIDDTENLNIRPGISLEIFNYGKQLQINQHIMEDVYSYNLAHINHFYIVNPENISILHEYEDIHYGKWAIGNVVIEDFSKSYLDVFISPLAYHALLKNKENEDIDGYLILARLISLSNNACFSGIFYGNAKTAVIISDCYSDILTKNANSFGSENTRPHWSPLLNEDEFKSYEYYQTAMQTFQKLNITPSQSTFPLLRKIKRLTER